MAPISICLNIINIGVDIIISIFECDVSLRPFMNRANTKMCVILIKLPIRLLERHVDIFLYGMSNEVKAVYCITSSQLQLKNSVSVLQV